MGLIITRYESAANGNIKFDSSKFDYIYDSDPFPEDSQTDFDNIIDEVGSTYSILTEVITIGSMGSVTNITQSEFSITAYIMDITKKDRQIHEMGLAVPGNRTIYFKTEYADSNVVKEDDILVDTASKQWRIVKILDEPYISATQIYKKAVVKSINLEGSN